MTEKREIRRLAIVNRGEAAVRCIRAVRTLRAMEGNSMKVLSLYTSSDANAPFVRMADAAVELDSQNGAVAAYLDHEQLIEALLQWKADAVWPGWGFVAEDPEFVEKVESAGIRFLGPSADSMRSLGDKIRSKQLAEKAGVPVTAWSGGALADLESAKTHAARIGYPVMLKATAGGGGRGIRVVRQESEVEGAYRSATAEALSAFGNGDLFCEKLVTGGRHIEVQIVADEHDHIVALGCRDCSVQRRHQKVLEEAPPPWLAQEKKQELEEAAILLARQVSYRGAGTVEFLLEGDHFYFLEVNPRLQVEHGITEEITGLDLVAIQIRIARNESLADLQVRERGVAIEARVCAEDPDANFLPAPGSIVRFDPSLGPGVRIDSGVSLGTFVSPDFDSLIAKVIASGKDREEARARLECALRDFDLVVDGGATNKGYLIELLGTADYAQGPTDTTWLDRWNEERSQASDRIEVDTEDALVAASIIAYQRARLEAREFFYSDTAALSRERIPQNQGQQIDLNYRGETYRVLIYAIGSWRYRIHLEGSFVTASMQEEGPYRSRLQIEEIDLATTQSTAAAQATAPIAIEAEQLPDAVETQAAGLYRITLEMTLEKPVV